MSKHDRIQFESTDYLDSRDLEERFDYLTADDDRDEDEDDELDALTTIRDQYGDTEEWQSGVTLIPEEQFQSYAEELATEIGAIDPDTSSWPLTHIDWKAAAEELRNDYHELEVTIYGLRTVWLAR